MQGKLSELCKCCANNVFHFSLFSYKCMIIHRLLLYHQQSQTDIHEFAIFSFHKVVIWAADYYHKFVKKSLFVVCGCMFLVKNTNSLVS